MDTLLPLLKTIAHNRQSQSTPDERKQSRGRSRGDKNNGELEVLLLLLLRKGMEYAAKRYLASDHGTKRREDGQHAVDADGLERLGRAILEKFMGKNDGKENDGRRRGGERGRDEEEGMEKMKVDDIKIGRMGGRKTTSIDGDIEMLLPSLDLVIDGNMATIMAGTPVENTTCITNSKNKNRTDDIDADIAALIGMNERPVGRPGHEGCEYYDLFVAASTPLQDAIGGVLGQMREVEGKKGRGRRRHDDEHKERREKEVPEPEVSRGRTRRRQKHGP
ncbi:hypothetical protein ACHAQH_004186 [Verticillium albo-atrum]